MTLHLKEILPPGQAIIQHKKMAAHATQETTTRKQIQQPKNTTRNEPPRNPMRREPHNPSVPRSTIPVSHRKSNSLVHTKIRVRFYIGQANQTAIQGSRKKISPSKHSLYFLTSQTLIESEQKPSLMVQNQTLRTRMGSHAQQQTTLPALCDVVDGGPHQRATS